MDGVITEQWAKIGSSVEWLLQAVSRFEFLDLFTTLSSLYFLRREFVFFPGVSCYCLDNSYVSGFLPSISLTLCSQLPKTVDPLY